MLLLVFWVVAGSVINLVSSYGRETYQRREFVLNYRVFKEKEVADKFLYKMIPNTVAETMKAGRKALAETFENVTILYSDIQGFTSYAASSNPENVVKLLSSLFTEFDKLTKELNVYKIQTYVESLIVCFVYYVAQLDISCLQYRRCLRVGQRFAVLHARPVDARRQRHQLHENGVRHDQSRTCSSLDLYSLSSVLISVFDCVWTRSKASALRRALAYACASDCTRAS
jgi:class 3 adenylate cyclase